MILSLGFCVVSKEEESTKQMVMMRVRRNQSWFYLRRCELYSEEENTNAAGGKLRRHRYIKVGKNFLEVYWYHSILDIRCWCSSFSKILINSVRFIMSRETAAQSYWHPASFGSSHDSTAILKETIKGTSSSGCGIKDASSIRIRVSTYLVKCYYTEKVSAFKLWIFKIQTLYPKLWGPR
jgi:hypothetical protein